MNPLEVKWLNAEAACFQQVHGFIDRHPVLMTLAVFYLLLMSLVVVIVNMARRRAKRLIQPGPHVIYLQSEPPHQQPEEPAFDPFPPMRERDYEYERLIDPDCRED